MEGPDKKSKWHEMRKNKFQRQLTQQLIDEGIERSTAIRHAEVSIHIATETFDSHNKPLHQVVLNNFRQAKLHKSGSKPNGKVVYLSPAPWQPNPVLPTV
ncbi:MAG: hypothetical protein L6Q77_13050 [Bacteroidetes bacterium]|nr:hypothetical protein [Bacteroidota bacterium]